MTEIPEHLLKRSRERRAAITGDGGDDGASDASPAKAASAPAKSEPAAPAGPQPRGAAPEPPKPAPPKPDSPVVAAYKKRKRIPGWAMLGLGLLPVWGFMYAKAVTAQPVVPTGPLAVGAEVYGICQSCHGTNASGGVGYGFADGEVLKTFPHIEDQLRFVYWGSDAYAAADISIYGNPEREGGAHEVHVKGIMPFQGVQAGGALADDEILGAVCHERYTIGGAESGDEQYAEEYENWCSEESPVFEALEGGASLTDLDPANFEFEMLPIGEPAAGSPPSS